MQITREDENSDDSADLCCFGATWCRSLSTTGADFLPSMHQARTRLFSLSCAKLARRRSTEENLNLK